MSKIRILSENLCNKIAAGEVVERPASVVKELIENSLDAGADEILIDIESGGKKLIRIQDNGSGMSKDDTFLALERHATSKIESDDDLFKLTTLGFRGEALPSIAAVSQMTVESRDNSSESGWRIRVNGGSVADAAATGMPVGTSIEVRNLFFNTPARRKFLRRDQTETGHVGDVVSRQALSRPEVRFRLTHNGRTMIDALKAETIEERVAAILGREAVREMVPVTSEVGELALYGLLSKPLYNRSATTSIYTYINGRYIRDRVVQHAVMEGYRNLLMKGRYPVVALFLDLPPELVDVNVHPTKHEVRFREQSQVHGFIAGAVRNSLRPVVTTAVGIEDSIMPPVSYQQPSSLRGVNTDVTTDNPAGVRDHPEAYRSSERSEPFARPVSIDRGELFHLPGKEFALGQAGSMVVLGQYLDSYIICQDGDDLVLVDQHAAHERVAFERLKKQFVSAGVEQQSLLFPVVIDFDYREATVVGQSLDHLSTLGFELEPFGGNSYILKASPQLLKDSEAERLVRDVASELAELGETAVLDDAYEDLLATMACHSVVRANQKLSLAEMQALLVEIDSVDFSAHCPHGRPVLCRLGKPEIERMFKRT